MLNLRVKYLENYASPGLRSGTVGFVLTPSTFSFCSLGALNSKTLVDDRLKPVVHGKFFRARFFGLTYYCSIVKGLTALLFLDNCSIVVEQ